MTFPITTPYIAEIKSQRSQKLIFRNLETDLNDVLAWFNIDSLKANPGKFQFMVLGIKEKDHFVLNIGENKIESSTEVTLLEVKIDKQLKFKNFQPMLSLIVSLSMPR